MSTARSVWQKHSERFLLPFICPYLCWDEPVIEVLIHRNPRPLAFVKQTLSRLFSCTKKNMSRQEITVQSVVDGISGIQPAETLAFCCMPTCHSSGDCRMMKPLACWSYRQEAAQMQLRGTFAMFPSAMCSDLQYVGNKAPTLWDCHTVCLKLAGQVEIVLYILELSDLFKAKLVHHCQPCQSPGVAKRTLAQKLMEIFEFWPQIWNVHFKWFYLLCHVYWALIWFVFIKNDSIYHVLI